MKTWVFTQDSLSTEIDTWVKRQMDTGHPKAVVNADFVAEAIVDFLDNARSLYRTYDAPQTHSQTQIVATKVDQTKPEEQNIVAPSNPSFEDTDITGMSPADMLKMWEQSK